MQRRHFRLAWSLVGVGALLMIGACGKRASQDASPVPPAPTPIIRLTDAAYKVEWLSNDVPTTMGSGRAVPVKVTVRNLSTETWPDTLNAVPTQPGAFAVRLGYRWLEAGQQENASYAGVRGDLPGAVAPGAAATIVINVLPPQAPGQYRLQLDLVCEMVTWFEGKGATKLIVPVTVK